MVYIEIIKNADKYLEELKTNDKVKIVITDIKQSDELLKRNDPLWGYYNVKSFLINNEYINPKELLPDYYLTCGDFYCGWGYLLKRDRLFKFR